MPRLFHLLILIHRYLGILMCLFFALWFASGVVLLFVPYPRLSETERFAFLREIDWPRIRISPAAAFPHASLSEAPARVRLTMIGHRPAYHFHPWQGQQQSVYADTGEPVDSLSTADAISAVTVTQPGVSVEAHLPASHDQWTTHSRFDVVRPLYRLGMKDEHGTELYVSARSGEVVQQTTHFERGWSYLGAVIHWIYPTVLRRHFALWDRTVWWLALIAMGSALSGMILGISRLGRSTLRRWSPYRGTWYWHHIGGLGVSVFLLTWIFSGWLSMDHGLLFSDGVLTQVERERFAGGLLRLSPHLHNFAHIPSVREVEWVQVAGEAYIILRQDSSHSVVANASSNALLAPSLFPQAALTHAARAIFSEAAIATTDWLAHYDDYYYALDGSAPLPVLRVQFADPANTWLYINPQSGTLLEKLDDSRRRYRWLYSGLHRFDFPQLRSHETVRRLLILSLCSLGLLFSLTGVQLAWRRVFH